MVDDASWYYLWIERNGKPVKKEWVHASASWRPETDLPCGEYSWWVRAWNKQGFGAWSDGKHFDTECCAPEQVVLASPSLQNNKSPVRMMTKGPDVTYRWEAQPCASYYLLWVEKGGTHWHSTWLDVESKEALVAEEISGHPLGHFRWWIQAWSADGVADWSEPFSFFIGKPMSLDFLPLSDQKARMKWDNDSGGHATWFHLWINRGNDLLWRAWIPIEDTAMLGPERFYDLRQSFPSGKYTWWVQTWAPDGLGPWSDPAHFEIMENTASDILELARAQWEEAGPSSYSFTQSRACFCPPPLTFDVVVIDDDVFDVNPTDSSAPMDHVELGSFRTIEGLFDDLESLVASNPARLEMTFDPTLGYPTQISVDRSFKISDDEYVLTLSDLIPLNTSSGK